jgi:glutamine synthetase
MHDQSSSGLDPSEARLDEDVGAPRTEWSSDTLVDVFRDRRLRVLSLMHVGGDGWPRTLDFVPRDDVHLRDVLEAGERADGSSLFPGMGIPVGASDIVLRPRLGTGFVDPFAEVPTLVVLCGHEDRHGAPLPQSPDTIVRRAFARCREETGIELHALGEVEYFLGKRSEERDVYGEADRGYHAASPFVFGQPLRRQALLSLAEMGVGVKYAHSEVGYVEPLEGQGLIWEQHEIELALAPLPEAADAIVLTQWVVRNLAQRSGYRCTTDPMVMAGHPGNGLHVHLAPCRDGVAERRIGEPARRLIAGLVRHGAGLMAFGNRDDASYLRLGQGLEAPGSVFWGDSDRRALVRIPVVAAAVDGRAAPPTVEFRLPDGSALPHLLMAGIAQAMVAARDVDDLDGLLERTSRDSADATPVPRGFDQAADALAADQRPLEAGGVFPDGLIENAIATLRGRARGGS